jgi:hypothetical protein
VCIHIANLICRFACEMQVNVVRVYLSSWKPEIFVTSTPIVTNSKSLFTVGVLVLTHYSPEDGTVGSQKH